MKKYYVQHIAEIYQKNVCNTPPTKVHDRFLYGLDMEQFTNGFTALAALMRQLFSEIARDPANFGMTLKEITDTNAKTSDYTGSGASLLRVPNLLYILGAKSQLQSDMSLAIDGGVLADTTKQLKITGLPLLLSKLRECGFDVSDFGKAPKAGDRISVSYIDNRYLTVALKAMAEALYELSKGDLRNSNNDYFYMMHGGLLENETVKEPKLTVDFIFNVLDRPRRGYAQTLHKAVEDVTKQKMHKNLMRNYWTCTYTNKKSKKVLMTLYVEQDKLSVKLNLQNINMYTPLIKELPEKMQNIITGGGWTCGRGNCNPRCSGGFAFEIDGVAYDKCHCGSFVFHGLADEDVAHCQKLLERELGC